MKKILYLIILSFSLFNSASAEKPSINSLLKDGYKITQDQIISNDTNYWGTKVVTLKKRNDYFVCTMMIDPKKPRPAICVKP
jgi:hypothetical protein